jgi:predicted nucleotidyltransferase
VRRLAGVPPLARGLDDWAFGSHIIRMRLTEEEIHAIEACARRHFGVGCKVRVFGSRVDDTRRGGDIDLHVETDSPESASLQNELKFRLDLADRIGEQRVDVIVRAPGHKPRAIDLIADETGILLP